MYIYIYIPVGSPTAWNHARWIVSASYTLLRKTQCAVKYDITTCLLVVDIQTYGNLCRGGLIIIKIKNRKTAASGGSGGGQECGVMRTDVTRWYGGGGIGGHVGLMVNIMSESLNRVWTGGTVFFRQPTDQQSLVQFFDIVLYVVVIVVVVVVVPICFYRFIIFFFPVKRNNNNTNLDLYSPTIFHLAH